MSVLSHPILKGQEMNYEKAARGPDNKYPPTKSPDRVASLHQRRANTVQIVFGIFFNPTLRISFCARTTNSCCWAANCKCLVFIHNFYAVANKRTQTQDTEAGRLKNNKKQVLLTKLKYPQKSKCSEQTQTEQNPIENYRQMQKLRTKLKLRTMTKSIIKLLSSSLISKI